MKGKDISSLVINAGNFIGGVKGLGHFGAHPYATGAFAVKKIIGTLAKKRRSEYLPRLLEFAGTTYFGSLAVYDFVDVLIGNFSSIPNLLANGSMAVQLYFETDALYDEAGADLLEDLCVYNIGVSKVKGVEATAQESGDSVVNVSHAPRREAYKLIRFPGKIVNGLLGLFDRLGLFTSGYLPGQHPNAPVVGGPGLQKMLEEEERPLAPHEVRRKKKKTKKRRAANP
jgi:hypothetical protein